MTDYNKLTGEIISAAIEVHRELGAGLLESVYEECLYKELISRNLKVLRQAELPVYYKGEKTNKVFYLDLLVERKVIVELKSVKEILPIHEVQLVTYLKLSYMKVGLLINFNELLLKNGIRRRINGNID